MTIQSLSTRVGRLMSVPLAIPVAAGALIRRSRLFHPRGIVLEGRVRPAGEGQYRALGERLSGPVLARWSGAWWKRAQLPDVLGCSLRFSTNRNWDELADTDQDLLLATVRSPWTTLLASLSTDVSDFLANHYYGVSTFSDPDLGAIRVQLVPLSKVEATGVRAERLAYALRSGPIRFELRARKRGRGNRYQPVAMIELDHQLELDQEALAFDPFHAGRGPEPVGLVNGLRVATYALARRVRPRNGRSQKKSAAPGAVEAFTPIKATHASHP